MRPIKIVAQGSRFGRLVTVGEQYKADGAYVVDCICDCGASKRVRTFHLRTDAIQSCGCLQRELAATRMRSEDNPVRQRWAAHVRQADRPDRPAEDGREQARAIRRTRVTWLAMVERCTVEGGKGYAEYGAVGVTVCRRWLTFEYFLDDMGARPLGKTIDRIDGTLGYELTNCRWATHREQALNRRSTVFVTWRGKTQCISDWSRELGIQKDKLYYRIRRAKWSIERAMSTPE